MASKIIMLDEKNFLIIAPSWIGDLVISQSLLIQLKSEHPNCRIDVIARDELHPIISLMPEVNKIYPLNIEHGSFGFLKRLQLANRLKKNFYTTSFVLPNSYKSALIPWMAGIPKRIGYLREFRHILINKKYKYIKHSNTMANRYLKLADYEYTNQIKPQLNIKEEENQKVIKKFNINIEKKIIILCPDAEYGEAKKWPINKWIHLSKSFDKNEHDLYFLGKDKSIDIEIEKLCIQENIFSLINETTLSEVISLLNLSSLVISNDSGLMHVAASVNTNIIAIFGSTSPFYTPPLIDSHQGEIIYKQLDCSPCFKKTCPLGHLNCLNKISSEEVFESTRKYLL